MPIQVPTIQANNETQDNAPRVSSPGIDAVAPMKEVSSALQGAVETVGKVQNEIAYQKADTTATIAKNDFLTWQKKKMYGDPDASDPGDRVGIINQKGDPTTIYKQFEAERNKKLGELSNAPQDQSWSDMTQKMVNRRLNRADEETKLEMLTSYGHQQKKFDDDATTSRIDIARQGMPLASSFIVPGKDETFGPVQAKIADIRQALIAQAIRNKSAVFDPNGDTAYNDPATGKVVSVQLSDSVKDSISVEVGKGLSDTLENLINSSGPGVPDALSKAKAFKEKFGGMLDEYGKSQLNAKMEKAETEQDANDLAHSLRGKSPDQIDKALADQPEEVSRKALQYMSDAGRYRENLKKYQRDQNDEALVRKLQQFKQQNPAATVSDLENQPWYKNLAPRISLQQDKAARDFMNPPKKSDQAAVEKAFDLLNGNDPNIPDISKMTPAQAMQAMGGLGNDPVGAALKKRITEAVLPTNSQKNQQFQHAMGELKNQALNLHLVQTDNDGGTDIRKGGPEAEKLNALQAEFAQTLDKKGSLTYDQIKQEANDFVKNKVQNKPPGFFGRMFGGTTEAPQQQKPNAPSQAAFIGKAIKDWQQETGNSRRPNQGELQQYMNDNKKRYTQ